MMECVKQCYISYKHTVVNKTANYSSENYTMYAIVLFSWINESCEIDIGTS